MYGISSRFYRRQSVRLMIHRNSRVEILETTLDFPDGNDRKYTYRYLNNLQRLLFPPRVVLEWTVMLIAG